MKTCNNCLLPETHETIEYDTTGVCTSISSRRSSFDHNSVHSGPPSVDLNLQHQIPTNVTNRMSTEISPMTNLVLKKNSVKPLINLVRPRG